ncbi:hypothetical protein ACJRO7_015565 [Eucalyptus globulus]|uniref:FAD-binding domain-containing protein n=1 Tax=Eucalyptus globulus TaxID=34317 RepID=A0ABD3L9G9_EUCGL
MHVIYLLVTTAINNATDGEKVVSPVLTRDEEFNFRAAHWTDLHGLPCKVVMTNDTIEITGDLLIAADGCGSSIRQSFLPDLKLRYSGYCAWRGVLDFSGRENSEAILGIKRTYPDLGKCLYFDLGSGTHSVFDELLNKRLNWIWYINQPEPELKGNSVTMKVSSKMIQGMHREADKVWLPGLARIILHRCMH